MHVKNSWRRAEVYVASGNHVDAQAGGVRSCVQTRCFLFELRVPSGGLQYLHNKAHFMCRKLCVPVRVYVFVKWERVNLLMS